MIEFKFSVCFDTKKKVHIFQHISEYIKIFLGNIRLYVTIFTILFNKDTEIIRKTKPKIYLKTNLIKILVG